VVCLALHEKQPKSLLGDPRRRKEGRDLAVIRTVNGTEVKERNPFAVWGLALVTLGIYYWVWYYKVNKEMRRTYDIDVDPAMAVVAITFGAILIIPPFVSTYKTGRRVEQTQHKAEVQDRLSPIISFLLIFLFSLHIVYIQSNLNKVWNKAASPVRQPSEPPIAAEGA
jgi:hypothetical protein